jgi:acetyl-CoA carboxylase alpha subunit
MIRYESKFVDTIVEEVYQKVADEVSEFVDAIKNEISECVGALDRR